MSMLSYKTFRPCSSMFPRATRPAILSVLFLFTVICAGLHAQSGSASFPYSASPLETTVTPPNPSAVISNPFFGMTIVNLAPNSTHPAANMTPFPNFPVSLYRFWDVSYWAMIDTYQGQGNWSKLDNSLAIAQQNGVNDFIFTFGRVPSWASTVPTDPCSGGEGAGTCAPPNMDALNSFAVRVVQRYCGKIKYYEPWNEPNSTQFWHGTNAQLLAISQSIYQIVKDPANCGCTNGTCSPNGGENPNQVLLPPISELTPADVSWLDSYMSTAGSTYPYADVAAVHGYIYSGYPPEQTVSGIALLKQTLANHGLASLPIWTTEASWESDTNDSDQNQASWLMRYETMQAASGISRLVWYSYDNCSWGTLWSSPLCSSTQGAADPVNQLTVAGNAYVTIQSWLGGANITQCQEYQNGLWVCALQRPEGYTAWILWSSTGANLSIPIPPSLNLTVYRDSQNNLNTLSPSIAVIQMPVMLENHDYQAN